MSGSAPHEHRKTGAGAAALPASRDPNAWSAEYRDLARRIRSDHGDLVRGGGRVQPILEIQPGSVCPASCRFCPTQGAKIYPPERHRAPLGEEELRLLVKEFAAFGGETLILSGGLEPLAGPAIPTAAAAAEVGLAVHLYTSALSAALDDPAERRTLLASTRRIRVSLNGLSEGTYGEIQLGGRAGGTLFARVMARIEALACDRLRLASPAELGISFLATEANFAEVDAALELCDRLGLDFLAVLVDIVGDRAVPPDVRVALDAFRRRVAERGPGGPAVRVSGRTGTAPARTGRCFASRVKIVIDPFGLAWRCCFVAAPEAALPELLIGDVRAEGLRAVFDAAQRPVETGCATCPDFERTVNVLAEE
jgi:MoaA/NifB/PqqE/SkfB family radical SAM enzyme